MKALILSAGQGQRMRPLNQNLPKPLLTVGEWTLLEHHLIKLKSAGINDIYINVYHLAEMIVDRIGDGSNYGVNVTYVYQDQLLGSGGDTYNALRQMILDDKNSIGNLDRGFIMISADVYSEYDYSGFNRTLAGNSLGRLLMVKSDKYPDGCRYAMDEDGFLCKKGELWNWSSIAMLKPELFADCVAGEFPLIGLFDNAVESGRMEGECYDGLWYNLGTPQDLEALKSELAASAL